MKGIIIAFGVALVIGVLLGGTHFYMSMDMQRNHFVELKDSIQSTMRMNHQYRCCLEKPCTSCIENTSEHGEGAACDCLKDVVEGVHPCGECIGEILEGHGHQHLTEYFAKAIAEKTGHYDAIAKIIEEKYDKPVSEQLPADVGT